MSPNRRRRQLVRAAAAVFLAVVGAVVASFGNIHDPEHRVGVIAPAAAGAALVLLAGLAAVRTAARSIREQSVSKIGDVKGGVLGKVVGISGAVIVVLWTLSALRISVQNLLLGGALTGVVLGIAAQQTLGNIFAGIVLLIVKPFEVGEQTVIKSTLGEYEGEVTNIGFFYVSMVTSNGRVDVPNSAALASAVGPGARTTPADGEESEEEPGKESGRIESAPPAP